ncbi:unnamed protein product, partial [Vitis vinifera]
MAPEIYRAAAEGDTNILEGMPSADLRVQLTPNKNTVLHIAAQLGQLKCVAWIIQHYSVDSSLLQCPNLKGDSPLHLAAREGHLEVVKALIRAAETVSERDSESGIGADKAILRMTNNENDTALHEAVRYHHPEVVKLLIEEDPEFTYADENGWSPLHCAAYLDYVSIMRQLLDKSDKSVVYLRVKNDDNKTALHIAATRGNKRTAKLLVSRYPDCCEQVDINGNNALHLFMMQRRFFISLLKIPWMNVGALINEKNAEGQTPLHLLAHSQLRYRPAYIKNKKVDKMILNSQNLTAMDVISSAEDLYGHKAVIVRHLKWAKARVGPLLRQKTMIIC